MLQKNSYHNIKIHGIGSDGEGIGKIDDIVVFVPNAVTGDELNIKVIKTKKTFAVGKIEEIISPSLKRADTPCDVYGKCGGCNIQHLNYESQLEYKKQKVSDAIQRIGKLDNIKVNDTVSIDNPFFYRNKVQFPAGVVDNKLSFGFYRKRSHDIVKVDKCLIQSEVSESIVKTVEDFLNENNIEPYNEKTHKGLVRHLFIRVGKKTNEIMVGLVLKNAKLPNHEQLVEKLLQVNNNIKSIVVNVNRERTNKILGDKVKVLYGEEFITDYIEDIKFKISLPSFYQVNPVQTEKLYNLAVEYANLNGTETVIDAYCGIGTISLMLAKKCKEVYGVEIVEEAINDAKENAKINNIDNVNFLVGKAEEQIEELEKNDIQADVIVVDPPRKGCDEKLLHSIIDSNIKKMVYVSCDPATMSRDLNILCSGGFEIGEVTPVDMFSQTTHVECVVSLTR